MSFFFYMSLFMELYSNINFSYSMSLSCSVVAYNLRASPSKEVSPSGYGTVAYFDLIVPKIYLVRANVNL